MRGIQTKTINLHMQKILPRMQEKMVFTEKIMADNCGMRLKNALESELWLWSMQREKFSEMQKHIMKGVPGAGKKRPKFMLRRLTMLKFDQEKTFDEEIRDMVNEFDAFDENSEELSDSEGDDDSEEDDRKTKK